MSFVTIRFPSLFFTGSMAVVKEMIDQLVLAHPHIRFFHIGADEVNEYVVEVGAVFVGMCLYDMFSGRHR